MFYFLIFLLSYPALMYFCYMLTILTFTSKHNNLGFYNCKVFFTDDIHNRKVISRSNEYYKFATNDYLNYYPIDISYLICQMTLTSKITSVIK